MVHKNNETKFTIKIIKSKELTEVRLIIIRCVYRTSILATIVIPEIKLTDEKSEK